ncbi:MAG: ribbon-helix-helix protein, CopG family [Acidobacteriota bacterium]|nr:ribbon-helix-helix protein, CopG family [Acidobacteriota bacterium]
MATKRITISLPQKIYDEVEELAQREHRSMSELVREAIRHCADSPRGDGAFGSWGVTEVAEPATAYGADPGVPRGLAAAQSSKLDYLQRSTGLTVGEILQQGIDRVYEEARGSAKDSLRVLRESSFIGCGAGPEDLSESYKSYLGESLSTKHDPR